MYRYRYSGGTTRGAIERLDKVIPKLGTITQVFGYRYLGRYQTDHEAVMIKGTNGSARLSGLCWGYQGSGPSGVVELLKRLNVPEDEARRISQSTRKNVVGKDWELSF